MNKEEILKRSKQENKNKDERDIFYERKAETYATIISACTIVILIISGFWHKTNIFPYLTLLFAGIFGETLGLFLKKKSISNIISLVITALIFLFFLIKAFNGFELIIGLGK